MPFEIQVYFQRIGLVTHLPHNSTPGWLYFIAGRYWLSTFIKR